MILNRIICRIKGHRKWYSVYPTPHALGAMFITDCRRCNKLLEHLEVTT